MISRLILSTLLLTGGVPAFAQEQTVHPAEILQSAEQWMQENLDEDALAALGVDQARVGEFLHELQKRFQGTYVYDLGALNQTATNLLPVLQQFEETQPYAAWLETRLDYFGVAEKLQRETAAKPDAPKVLSLERERSVWVEELVKRPMPPRAEKLTPKLKSIFAAQNVPPELVWIAEVESSFDPKARSPAGAAGLFQLMPATARSLGLSLWPRDERLDPEKSARAAAGYLRYLHNRFGDWRLALAAYNAGEGRVGALLRKHGAQSFDGIARTLPAETQMYVPKVEAVVRKREGITLAALKPPKE